MGNFFYRFGIIKIFYGGGGIRRVIQAVVAYFIFQNSSTCYPVDPIKQALMVNENIAFL
jgi:hypothetical protein